MNKKFIGVGPALSFGRASIVSRLATDAEGFGHLHFPVLSPDAVVRRSPPGRITRAAVLL